MARMTQPIAARFPARSLSRDRRRCPAARSVLLPTVIASAATMKNQLPDMLIIMFQMRPGMANGTSSRQKRSQPLKRKPARRFVEIARHRAQRLVEAERHVPGLRGEDREDRRRASAPATRPGNSAMKKVTVNEM